VSGRAMIDGRAVGLADAAIPVTDPAVTLGWSVFETVRSVRGVVPHLDEHLDRLEGSCRAALIPMPPRGVLRDEIAAVAGADPLVRVRITLTGGGRRIVTGEPGDPSRLHRPVKVVRGVHRDDPVLPGFVKHGSRASWTVAVRRAAVDEVLFVDSNGRFTEGTSCAVLAVVGERLFTAPDDGRILSSRTCADVVGRAQRLGIDVVREGPLAQGPWDGLYVASTTRDLAPVVQIDGVTLAGWEPIGKELASEASF
jgi:branched-subunit amino acid aminotransferase/4-amino-4-deoxychorismate lyase